MQIVIEIPENATNGDVIKAVFDVKEVRQLDCCAFIDTSDDANMRTYKDWWNAPYKAESEDKHGRYQTVDARF